MAIDILFGVADADGLYPFKSHVSSFFLVAGKTSLLQHMLENREGIKIAVIVNDVASVNIDSKLVSGSSNADGLVQLQNGCACCSLADELLGRCVQFAHSVCSTTASRRR